MKDDEWGKKAEEFWVLGNKKLEEVSFGIGNLRILYKCILILFGLGSYVCLFNLIGYLGFWVYYFSYVG